MSHFTKLDRCNIIDAEAFVAACQELGFLAIRQNVEIRDYYGQTMQVDIAINCGRYDIALKKNAAGTYDLVADWWGVMGSGNKLPEKLRAACRSEAELQNMLLKYTTKHTIISRYKRQGFRAIVKEDAEQNLHVELVRGY